MTSPQTRWAVALLTTIAGVCVLVESARSQSGPDPHEIPVPSIRTRTKPLPSVKDLPGKKVERRFDQFPAQP